MHVGKETNLCEAYFQLCKSKLQKKTRRTKKVGNLFVNGKCGLLMILKISISSLVFNHQFPREANILPFQFVFNKFPTIITLLIPNLKTHINIFLKKIVEKKLFFW